MRLLWGIFVLAATSTAVAAPDAALPERWQRDVALGADRGGDLRPIAHAILDAADAAPDRVLTTADLGDLGAVAPALEPPATIRVWRRALDRLAPAGRVKLGDETWNAISETPAEPGETMVVIEVKGLTLSVRPSKE